MLKLRNGYTGFAEINAAGSYDMFIILSTTRVNGGWMYFKIHNDSYMQLSGSDNKVSFYKDTPISGNLDVGKVLALKRVPGVSDTSPLTIINESPGGGTGVVYQSTASDQGSLITYVTAQSSVAWVEGVNRGGSNEFIIKSGSNGLILKPTGDAVISGNLDVGVGASQTSIKPYVDDQGHTGNVQIKATWNSQGYINFNTTNPDGLLLTATKDDLYLYCALNTIYFHKPTTNASDDRLKRKRNYRNIKCM